MTTAIGRQPRHEQRPALRDVYQGELRYHYTKGERLLRVTWSR